MKHPVLPAPALKQKKSTVNVQQCIGKVKGVMVHFTGIWSTGWLLKLSQAFAGLQTHFFYSHLYIVHMFVIYIINVFLFTVMIWAPVASATCVWRIHSKEEAEVDLEFNTKHNREISVLPTCSEQPEAQRLADSWIWPAVQTPAGPWHGTGHHGLASPWSGTDVFPESHEHLSVEKTRVEIFKSPSLAEKHPPPTNTICTDCWRASS